MLGILIKKPEMILKIFRIVSILVSFFVLSCDTLLDVKYNNSYVPELVFIKKYLPFTMGCNDLPGWICNNNEIPPIKVVLSQYYIGKYEVRNDEYNYFVKSGGYNDSTLWSEEGWKYILEENRDRPINWIEGEEPWIKSNDSNTPNKPINNICWYEAEAYCNWLSKKTGENYSLPTEAQWERAARGPDPGRPFPWGNEDDKTKYNVLTISNKLYPVGSFVAGKSYEGCYDMSGNVMEFCSDWYDLYIYKKYKENEPLYNPLGPESSINGQKSIRGARTTFHPDPDIEESITTYRRSPCAPYDHSILFGIRVVKNLK